MRHLSTPRTRRWVQRLEIMAAPQRQLLPVLDTQGRQRFDESESRLIAVVHAPPMTCVRLGLDLLSANELRRVPVGGSGWLLVVFGRGTSRVSTAAVSKRGHRLDDGLERCVGRHQEGYVGCAGQVPSGELGLGVVG